MNKTTEEDFLDSLTKLNESEIYELNKIKKEIDDLIFNNRDRLDEIQTYLLSTMSKFIGVLLKNAEEK